MENMEKFEIVDISWTQRKNVLHNSDSGQYEIPDKENSDLNRCGFYCIYGRHPVYGPDVLLYIGETKEGENKTRSFKDRLAEHFGRRFWYHQNLSFSLGICQQKLLDAEVQLVESILIAAHKPALNKHHLDCAKRGSEKFLVRNWDFSGALQHGCTGSYWRQEI